MSLGMAASIYRLKDSLFNLVSGLGTAKDPRQWTNYAYQELARDQLEAMYRSDWLARRIVDLPADDATRQWRSWTADRPKMERIDALERKLELQKKVRQALIRARLYGGGALILGVDQGNSTDELSLEDVGLNDLKWVIVVNRWELAAGPRIYNVDSPYYTRPQYYTVSTPTIGVAANEGVDIYSAGAQAGGAPQKLPPALSDPAMMTGPPVGLVQVHPSRVIEFAGNELPDWRLAPMGGGWGDSVLQTVEDSLKDFAMIMGGLASMINDMKMDVIKVPELSRKLSTAEMTQKTLQRFGLANMAKSSINTLLLDKDEEWQRIQTSFGSTPELIKVAMQVASAAGGVPESRLMGNAPNKGLQAAGASGGEVDIKNYYDDIASNQKSKYKPALLPLDVCIQRSALGRFDPGIDYEWNPLYQPDPSQMAAVALQKAQTTQVYVSSGLINEDALREATISQLTEDGIYPGLEDAIDEFGSEPEAPPAPLTPLPPTPPPGMIPKGQFDPNPFHMLRATAAAKAGLPIRVPPNRPGGPPKFAPSPPGAQPPAKKLGDYDPDQPRDESGKWSSGSAFASAQWTASGVASGSFAASASAAAKASHDFMTSAPVRRGLAAVVASAALETTAAAAHETVLHTMHKGVEAALDSAIGLVGAHLLGHAGLVAGGALGATVAPVAIAVIAGVAVHKLSDKLGITEENSKKLLSKSGHFLLDHYQQLKHEMAQPLHGSFAEQRGRFGDADPDGPDVVLQALLMLVPHWDV